MNILIDIGHPAHVHLFKNFAQIMQSKGHRTHFTVRDKEFEIELLEHQGLSFTKLGKHYISGWGRLYGWIKYNFRIFKISLWFKPDLYLSHGSIYTLLSSFLLRKPNIILEDTGNKEQVRIYRPFASVILTPTGFPYRYGKKQIFYNGVHEMAYLHPDYFMPDSSVLKDLDVKEGEKFFILRFVSWNASHDRGKTGLSQVQKYELINALLDKGKVFISSESPLPSDLSHLSFPLSSDRIHDALAFAYMFIGEGVTMASEAAVLGTIAICINTSYPVYADFEQKYGLICNFISGNGVLSKVLELIKDENLKNKARALSGKLLGDKINLTSFMVWLIENYPERITESEINTLFRKQISE